VTELDRRRLLWSLLGAAGSLPLMVSTRSRAEGLASCAERLAFTDPAKDYHGFALHDLSVDGCAGHIVLPERPLLGQPWVWRTMFWDDFQNADIAFLKAGFHVAYLGVGNSFGSPDAMQHFDAFYAEMRGKYALARKPALEGLSRGGLYAYRWACANAAKVGAVYGDAPVCDLKSWPDGKGKGDGSPDDWTAAIKAYRFADEAEMMAFRGNPIDTLASLAALRVPILHVCGDADTAVPQSENTDVLRARYMALGGPMALIIKHGCGHHPHGSRTRRRSLISSPHGVQGAARPRRRADTRRRPDRSWSCSLRNGIMCRLRQHSYK